MAKKDQKPAASTDRFNKRIRERDKTTPPKSSPRRRRREKRFKGGDINMPSPPAAAPTRFGTEKSILQMGDAKASRESSTQPKPSVHLQTVLHGTRSRN